MARLPPAVREAEFQAVDTTKEDEIKRRFAGFLRTLHVYLNGLPCLQDIQSVRRRWRARIASQDAFGNFATDPKHWYTFHKGGRNEAQFNYGLYPTHLRIGLGFEFSMKKGGDPTKVHLTYACFTNILRGDETAFTRFVVDNHLEVEWAPTDDVELHFVPTREVVPWLYDPPREPMWIFIGRLLRRETDAHVLADQVLLGDIMETVLCGFRPWWERTQLLASIV
jgi:hypothetical protein